MDISYLSKSAQIVQDALLQKNVRFKVVELSESTRSASDAAKAIGCTEAQIIKSLIFKTKETGMPILILASGINRVNEKSVEAALGQQIAKADADFVREMTGFAIGGVPPIGHKNDILTLVDSDLINYEELWAAAGTPNSVFSLKSNQLLDLTNGKLLDIK